MNLDGLLDDVRTLPPEVVAALGALAAFLAVFAVAVQLSARRMRRELFDVEEELVDRETGLLPRSALRVRLGAELAWASTTRTPVAIAVLRIRGSRFVQAARALRHSMREEEAAFLLGDQRVVVELWGVDASEAAGGTRRLGEDLARAGHPVVDVGLACSPRDGTDVDTLVAAAQRDLRPVDDPRHPGLHVAGDGTAHGAFGHAMAVLAGVLPWFMAMGLLLLLTWRLLPAAIEPALAGSRSGEDLAYAIVAAVGLPLGAALLHVSCWNLGGGVAPSSRPVGPAGLRTAIVLAAVIGTPLAWGIFAPEVPEALADAFGASLAMLVLVVLVAVHGRQLVHVVAPVLAVLVACGGVLTWATVELSSYPVVANAGRLLLAAALGALLARLVERASWIVLLALLAGVVDAWSVYSDSGLTNRVLDAAGTAEGDLALDLLLFTGPIVDGAPLFAFGVTDLVFLSLFLAWSHDWRVDMRVAAGAMLAATWATLVAAEATGDVIPMLPFLSTAIVFVVALRSVQLRRRVASWTAESEAATG
jgi:hypothetical protein